MKKTKKQIKKDIETTGAKLCDLRLIAMKASTDYVETMIRDMESTPGQYLGENSVIKKVHCRPDVGYEREFQIDFNNNHWNGVKLINPTKYNNYTKPTWEFQTHSNYYSTATGKASSFSDSFELLIFFGAFAKTLQEKSPEILSMLASIKTAYEPKFKALYDEKFKLEQQLREIETKAEEDRQQETLKKLMSKDGLEVPQMDRGHCYLSVRRNEEVYGVRNVKVLSLTKSKKSASIEVTTVQEKWDREVEQYIPTTTRRNYNNVRYDNIQSFINEYVR